MIALSLDNDSLYAGADLTLLCNYTLPQVLIEDALYIVVTWSRIANNGAVDTTSDRISTEGDTLTFSPLATSDTGRYTCELTVAEDLRYVTIEAPVQSKENNVAVLSKSYISGKCFVHQLHVYVYFLTVPVPHVVTTQSRTTPLYAGTSVTLTCTMTLHPNVDHVNVHESVMMSWYQNGIITSRTSNRYSLTTIHISGRSYTRNLTISPLVNTDSGRYLCSVIVKDVNNKSDIEISVLSK